MSGSEPLSGRPGDTAVIWGEPQTETPDHDQFAEWGAAENTASTDAWDAPADTPGEGSWGAPPQQEAWPTGGEPTWGAGHQESADVPVSSPSSPAEANAAWYQPEPAPADTGQGGALPHSAAELISDIPDPGEPKARRGWRALFGLAPGPAELAERQDLARVRRPLVGAKTITVASVKGGAGKTPVTLLLAGALGVARGGSVVAVDNNELRGTMPLRTLTNGCHENVRTFLDNIETLQRSMSTAEIQQFMRHQGAGQYDALVCATDTRHEVTADEYQAFHDILARVYQLTVVDTGNNEGAQNWKAAMASADVLVVPVKRSSASTCVAAAQMLEELQRELPHLVRNVVVVFTDGPGPVDKEVYAKYRNYFEQRARAVVEIPTDPHIAEECPIEHDRLKPKTRRAALGLAAAVSDVLAEPS